MPTSRDHNRLIEKSSKKPGEMEARTRGWVQARYCNVQRPSSYGRGKRCKNVTRIVLNHHSYLWVSSAQAKGDSYRSVAANLVREAERNKLSSLERVWLGGAL